MRTNQTLRRLLTGVGLLAWAWSAGCAADVSVSRADPAEALARQLTTRLVSGRLSGLTQDALNLVDLADVARRDPLAAVGDLRVLAESEPDGPWRVAAAEILLDLAERGADPSLDLACAREADRELEWAIAQGGGLLDARTEFAADLYRRAVARFIDTSGQAWLRDGSARHYRGNGGDFEVRMAPGDGADRYGPSRFDSLRSADFLRVEAMRNRHRLDGYGAPVVAIREQRDADPPRSEPFIPPEGLIGTGTVTLRFEPGGLVVLELWNTDRVATIDRHGAGLRLSADVTAPVAELFARASLVGAGRRGLTDVERFAEQIGIYFHEPYDPEKIPVLMVHGLRSSPATWRDMLNDLRADPEIRRRYQFWKFFYPSGLPIPRSASYLRRALRDVRAELDPRGTSETLPGTVLVGHSMGGLLSKAVVQSSGDRLWRSLHPEPFEAVPMGDEVRAHLREVFFYEADEHVARVIFIASPHRGSELAGSWIGRLGDALVDLPGEFGAIEAWFRDEQARIGEADAYQLARGVPSSIDDLREDSPHLMAYLEMPMRDGVPYHSIAGDGAGDSDGVVPVRSALLDGSDSELVVDAGHDAHAHPLAIREVRRILLDHASPSRHGTGGLGIMRDDRRAGVVEARSRLGEPLRRPGLDPSTRARLQADLDDAWDDWQADPTSEMSFVWLGRRLAYLGRYRDAVRVFTAGLEVHPDSYRLLRHRGHRHITTRQFELAIADLSLAERIITEGSVPDQIEPDGAPNEQGIPLTTTHSNIYYHLALAHYLRGAFEEALGVHERGAAFGQNNDDQRVSRAYWVYRTLRELGRDDEARGVLDEVLEHEPSVIENHAYLAALKRYRAGGPLSIDATGGIQGATLAYGLGAELLANGRDREARATLTAITNPEGAWAAFGFIAAEVMLERAR